MNKFWQNLNERERLMTIAAVAAASFYLFYVLLYSPMVEQISTKSEQLIENRATLTWMKQLDPKQLNANAPNKVSNNQLIILISNELKNSNTLKFPYQLQQTSSGEIQLSFEKVPFQYVITWVAKLRENYQFTIKQFNVEKTETSGVTKLYLILSVNP